MQTVDTPWTNVLAGRPELFRRASMMLALHYANAPHTGAGGKGHRLLFSGMLRCDCGHVFLAKEGPTGDPLDRSLRCPNHKMGAGCERKRAISLRLVEQAILGKLGALLSGPRFEEEFVRHLVEQSEARASDRAIERRETEKEIRALEARLALKMREEMPPSETVRAAHRGELRRLGDLIEGERSRCAVLLAPVPVHSLSGGVLGTLNDELGGLIRNAPMVCDAENDMRLRHAVRTIVTDVTFTFLDERTIDLGMTFDFRDPLARAGSLGVFRDTARIDIRTLAHKARDKMRTLATEEEIRLTPADVRVLDDTPVCRRLFRRKSLAERTALYNIVLLIMATRCSARVASAELGMARQRSSFLLSDLRNSSDLDVFSDSLRALRPDLDLDVEQLRPVIRNYKSLRYRLGLVDHPILRHPLCDPAHSRNVSEDEWELIVAKVSLGEVWRTKEAKFRNFVNAFFSLARSGGRQVDLAPEHGNYRRFAQTIQPFMYDGDLARITGPLLVHAGMAEAGERIVCKLPPTIGRGDWKTSADRYDRALRLSARKEKMAARQSAAGQEGRSDHE